MDTDYTTYREYVPVSDWDSPDETPELLSAATETMANYSYEDSAT